MISMGQNIATNFVKWNVHCTTYKLDLYIYVGKKCNKEKLKILTYDNKIWKLKWKTKFVKIIFRYLDYIYPLLLPHGFG